jgi:Zn-dependent protease with chaperone function
LGATSLLWPAEVAAFNVFAVPETSAATRAWSSERDLLWVAKQVATFSLLSLLLFSGLGRRLSSGLNKLTGGRRPATAALLAGICGCLDAAVSLPISAAGQVLASPLGLAAPTWAEWLFAKAREAAVLATGASLLGLAAYWLFAKSPRFWPVWAGALAIVATALSLTAQPLAHELRPLEDPALLGTISRLAARADAPTPRAALRVSERAGLCGGASVLGLGPTKVLVLDTALLRHHPPREIEQTIAHELKHYIHGDDKKALYAAIFMIVGGLAVLSFGSAFAVRVSGGRWGFDRISDPASVPLLALIALVLSLVAAAGFHAYGHHIEQEADRFSLDLTHDRVAQAALMQRLLSCSRLRNPDVGWVQKTFRQNHPSIRDRIEQARRHQ